MLLGSGKQGFNGFVAENGFDGQYRKLRRGLRPDASLGRSERPSPYATRKKGRAMKRGL